MVPKLTHGGIGLMVGALSGGDIVFTKIAIGDGDVPEYGAALTGLQHEVVRLGISELVTEEQYVILRATMSNADLETGFYWSEIGVYVQNPNGGEDILFAYDHYAISGEVAATYIPASGSGLVEITHSVHVFVGELENVSAVLTQHSEFASAAALEAHIKNKDNPHAVTKEAVGLGLIINATPENQKPVFPEAASAYSVSADGAYTFPNIFSGEAVGNILRKVRTIIDLVVKHFNADNPHKGAAGKNHKHSAADINGGALAMEFGGTGAVSAAEARKNLGIQSGSLSTGLEAGKETVEILSFPASYAAVPAVVATPVCVSGDVRCCVVSASATGVAVSVYSDTYSGSATVCWIACPRE